MDRQEIHFVACALCGQVASYSNVNQVAINMQRHARLKHDKVNSYVPDAMRSLAIVFEGSDPNKIQPMSHTDPTSQFLMVTETLRDAGRLD